MPLYCVLSIQPLILNSLYIRYLSLPQASLHTSLDMVPLRGAWTNTDQLHVPCLFLPAGGNCKGIFRYQFPATETKKIKSFIYVTITVFAVLQKHITIECVHMMSPRPCCRSKQRNGGHVGGKKYSFGDWTLFFMQIPPFVSLCKYGFWSHERTHSITR